MIAATAFHTLLLENERVRVLEVRIRPGEFVPVHTPSVTCVVSGSHFLRRDEKGALLFDSRTAGAPPEKPAAQWTPPLPPHSVENVGNSEILLIFVELKDPS